MAKEVIMSQINIPALIDSCDTLQRRTIWKEGFMHSSARCFDACMRMFDRKNLPAQAVTFRVYFNAPVIKEGEATIYRDGHMEMRTVRA